MGADWRGNPRSSYPCLVVVSAAGGGGAVVGLRWCPGVAGVHGLRDLSLVSSAGNLGQPWMVGGMGTRAE